MSARTAGAPARQDWRWRAIVALGLLGMLAGLAWGIADRPRYTATASVITAPGSGDVDRSDLRRYAQLGKSRDVADLAAGLLGGDVPGADLLSDVSVAPAPDGVSLIVTASSEQPDFAAAAADGYAQALVQEAEGTARGDGDGPLALGAAAQLPGEPTENRSGLLWAAIGLLAGLLVGGLAALLAGRRRTPRDARVTPVPEPAGEPYEPEPIAPKPAREEPAPITVEPMPAAAEPAAAVPILAAIPRPEEALRRQGPGRLRLRPAAAGPFRDLVDDLELDGEGGPRSVAVTALAEGGDAGPVALALAAAAAEVGLRVILLEADADDPAVAERAELEPEPGLADYLAATSGPRDVLRSVMVEAGAGEPFPLAAVPAGRAGVVGSPGRLEALLRRLPRVYDLVVLHAPPVDRGAAGEGEIARLVEGVILVLPEGIEDGEEASAAQASLAAAPLLGAVRTGR